MGVGGSLFYLNSKKISFFIFFESRTTMRITAYKKGLARVKISVF